MNTLRALVALLAFAIVAPAEAAPKKPTAKSGKVIKKGKTKVATRTLRPIVSKKRIPATKKGAAAHIAFGADLRTAPDVVGRRDEPLTLEEATAKEIEKIVRGPLRNGLTGLYVADAKTGVPLFSVNADDPLNPASNVKMISTATALDLLGPDYRYPTRVLGSDPVAGVVHGDIYLLGSYDPTLTTNDLDDLALTITSRGIKEIEGDIVVGSDATRDGLYRSRIPVQIVAGEPGEAPLVTPSLGADHVTVLVTAKTAKRAMRPRLTYQTTTTKSATGIPLITLTVGGTIGKGGSTVYSLATRERTATAAYALRASLRSHGVKIHGDYKILELGDFIGDSVMAGTLPIELGRHESHRLADIVAQINKRSINWLADRVVVTATALARHTPPSMELAIDAMYGWLERNAHLQRKDLLIDTGSGLSYKTQITTSELVAIVRAAGGFMPNPDSSASTQAIAKAWLESLSIAGTDGTLRHRVRGGQGGARIRGKSGTLSTSIAMSGILDIDPARPLVFSLVTNTEGPLAKAFIRKAHDRVLGTLCHYLAQTSRPMIKSPVPTAAVVVPPIIDPPASPLVTDAVPTSEPDEEETQPSDDALDAEAATAR